MLFKGFRFGMLLQITIGPICLLIFQTASLAGFFAAETGVLGVALVDALYILAAILGIGSLIEKRQSLKLVLKIFGSFVLIAFGLNIILGAFGIELLPVLNASDIQASNAFIRMVIMTLSNPLTIVFWAGLFSVKIAEENIIRKQLTIFGTGAVLSTIVFLTFIAGLGSFSRTFLPPTAIIILNATVGVVLIFFGIRTFVKKV